MNSSMLLVTLNDTEQIASFDWYPLLKKWYTNPSNSFNEINPDSEQYQKYLSNKQVWIRNDGYVEDTQGITMAYPIEPLSTSSWNSLKEMATQIR